MAVLFGAHTTRQHHHITHPQHKLKWFSLEPAGGLKINGNTIIVQSLLCLKKSLKLDPLETWQKLQKIRKSYR